MANKKSFYLYNDSLKIEEKLTDEQLGKLFRAIIKYQEGEEIELPFEIELVFDFFKNQFDRDLESYEKQCEKNKLNGSKGGRPKTQNQKNPSGFEITQKTQANQKNHDKDTDKDTENGKDIDKKRYNYLKELEVLKTDWNKKTVDHQSSNPSARNGESVFTSCRKVTPDIEKEYKAKRKNYSYEDVRHGIGQYYLDIIGRTEDTEKSFHTHRFSFYEFLKQSNGLTKFINK